MASTWKLFILHVLIHSLLLHFVQYMEPTQWSVEQLALTARPRLQLFSQWTLQFQLLKSSCALVWDLQCWWFLDGLHPNHPTCSSLLHSGWWKKCCHFLISTHTFHRIQRWHIGLIQICYSSSTNGHMIRWAPHYVLIWFTWIVTISGLTFAITTCKNVIKAISISTENEKNFIMALVLSVKVTSFYCH